MREWSFEYAPSTPNPIRVEATHPSTGKTLCGYANRRRVSLYEVGEVADCKISYRVQGGFYASLRCLSSEIERFVSPETDEEGNR